MNNLKLGLVVFILLSIASCNSANTNRNTSQYNTVAIATQNTTNGTTVYIGSHNQIMQYSGSSAKLIAGQFDNAGYKDGPVANALFGDIGGVAIDNNSVIYVSDTTNGVIRIIKQGVVTTMPLQSTSRELPILISPEGIVVDSQGNIYLSNKGRHIIEKITSTGNLSVFAGTLDRAGAKDGIGTAAMLNQPDNLLINSNNIIFVADTGNDVIRKILPDATVSTFVGQFGNDKIQDGVGASATLIAPKAIYFDATQNIIVDSAGEAQKDGFYKFRVIGQNGNVTTIDNPILANTFSDNK